MTETRKFSDKLIAGDWGWGGYGKGQTYEKCADTHPGLQLTGVDGQTHFIYGGAAAKPVKDDCALYVSLDQSTTHMARAYPWNNGPTFVHFPIYDFGVPEDPEEFKRLAVYVASRVPTGVHVGCQGGHGRTGMLLVAVTRLYTGEADAIAYVRQHYCKKAVESDVQSRFLETHFGVTFQPGAKKEMWVEPSKKGSRKSSRKDFSERYPSADVAHRVAPGLTRAGNIWGV